MTPARHNLRWTALALAAALTACGGGGGDDTVTIDTSNDRGSIVRNPPTQLAGLSAAQFTTQLKSSPSGPALLAAAGVDPNDPTATLPCGIDLRYLQFGTVGGALERTGSTGALMIPTGSSPRCSGSHPIVLYAHGTTVVKSYNIAALTGNAASSEGAVIAALFAAQGYIVVAPNYAGYDSSTLGYHPYLNADQQAKEMIDALAAGRKAVARIANGTTASADVYLAGYSQGAHVAMATHRAMQSLSMPVKAMSGGSGPYAIGMLVDRAMSGTNYVGGTIFTPLITTSWQRSYGDLYASVNDVYNTSYATGIDALLPGSLSTTALLTPPTGGGLPRLPQATTGADPVGLVRSDYAAAVAAEASAPATACAGGPATCGTQPTNKLRQYAYRNDLRNWAPSRPVLMCGGLQDPTVAYASTQATQTWFNAAMTQAGVDPAVIAQLIRTVDLDQNAGFRGTLNQVAAGAGAAAAAAASAAGGDAAAQQAASDQARDRALVSEYHSTLAPFCIGAAAQFFALVP